MRRSDFVVTNQRISLCSKSRVSSTRNSEPASTRNGSPLGRSKRSCTRRWPGELARSSRTSRNSSVVVAGENCRSTAGSLSADVDLSIPFHTPFGLFALGTFIFCAVMFAVAIGFLYFYFSSKQKMEHFILFQAFLFPVIFFFIRWFLKVLKDSKQASFMNTMRMNFIASTCMNLFFIVLLILNTNT